MYILNYIDRNALPQAKVQGISEDIGLAGIEYNIVLSLTFIGYILMQGQQNIKSLGNYTIPTLRTDAYQSRAT